MLNFDRNADMNDEEVDNIGVGGFGMVRVCKVRDKEVAVKRIWFRSKIGED
jgi:hypothetical protein